MGETKYLKHSQVPVAAGKRGCKCLRSSGESHGGEKRNKDKSGEKEGVRTAPK